MEREKKNGNKIKKIIVQKRFYFFLQFKIIKLKHQNKFKEFYWKIKFVFSCILN